MRVLLAFDKFKDALAAHRACQLAEEALRGVRGDWELDLCPLADGGEGFAEILTSAAGGELASYPVVGPREGLVDAPIGLVEFDRIPPDARALLGLGNADGGGGLAPPGAAPTGASPSSKWRRPAASPCWRPPCAIPG